MPPLSSSSSQVVSIRVLVASTGVCYNISLHPAELTVANIRSHLAAAVPLSDQILLLGPPYKVPKDSTLQSPEILKSLRLGDAEDDPIAEEMPGGSALHSLDSDRKDNSAASSISSSLASSQRPGLSTTERTGARRLFLFSKRALSENAVDLPPCRLEPMQLELPTEAPGSSPLNMAQSVSASPPLFQALSAYERQFMLYLCQGRVLADGADLRLSACRQCVQEQSIMARALRAAVSNLSDHFNGATRTRTEFTTFFQTKTSGHLSLLQRFESLLSGLGSIQLHPSLIQIARGSGRVMETLLDTVPVERERAWAQQCQMSHQRLVTLFGELDAAFSQIGSPSSRDDDTKQDMVAEENIHKLSMEVQRVAHQIRDRQAQRVERLTADHGKVVKIIMDATNAESDDGEEVQSAFTPLRQISNASKDIVPAMVEDDKVLQNLMIKVAGAKTASMKRMKNRLREISVAQSSIQRILSSVGVLKHALQQQNENMVHLEHVSELPAAYREFLSELQRRRAYGRAVTSSSTAMMERLAMMRSDEVKSRERFLRGPGRHLMPPFFEIFVPTLATPPPLFTPQMPALVELDMLPDISVADVESSVMMQGTQEGGGVSNASSLTTESHVPPSADKEPSPAAIADEPMSAAQQDQLIVSADEHSANDDMIMDPVAGSADAAERKTLAYENAVLRQAIERMGGKAPRVYIEESRDAAAASAKDSDGDGGKKQIALLQAELEALKAKAEAADIALNAIKKSEPILSDKISHSSFSIGDVALFMPTGRDKRTYLAFHTNCPHRYLSTDGIQGKPDFVLGRIVFQEGLVAGESGTSANPYGLHVGTKFWVLTVEVIRSTQS